VGINRRVTEELVPEPGRNWNWNRNRNRCRCPELNVLVVCQILYKIPKKEKRMSDRKMAGLAECERHKDRSGLAYVATPTWKVVAPLKWTRVRTFKANRDTGTGTGTGTSVTMLCFLLPKAQGKVELRCRQKISYFCPTELRCADRCISTNTVSSIVDSCCQKFLIILIVLSYHGGFQVLRKGNQSYHGGFQVLGRGTNQVSEITWFGR
jgi:hypothetical protein